MINKNLVDNHLISIYNNLDLIINEVYSHLHSECDPATVSHQKVQYEKVKQIIANQLNICMYAKTNFITFIINVFARIIYFHPLNNGNKRCAVLVLYHTCKLMGYSVNLHHIPLPKFIELAAMDDLDKMVDEAKNIFKINMLPQKPRIYLTTEKENNVDEKKSLYRLISRLELN